MLPAASAFRAFDWLPKTFSLIRRARGRTIKQMAEGLGMSPRGYQFLEAGEHKVSLERIAQFASAAECDPYGLMIAHFMGSPRFALRVADNKLMTILLMALQEFDEDVGDAIVELDARTCVSVFSEAFHRLAQEAHVRHALRRSLSPEDQEVGPCPPEET